MVIRGCEEAELGKTVERVQTGFYFRMMKMFCNKINLVVAQCVIHVLNAADFLL